LWKGPRFPGLTQPPFKRGVGLPLDLALPYRLLRFVISIAGCFDLWHAPREDEYDWKHRQINNCA
jgi:hypothetical protein